MIIRPLQGKFAAEVVGLELPVDDAAFAEVEAAWTRHPILVFRDLDMTPEQHIAFTRRFGPLHIMEPLQYNLPGHPEIFVVSNLEEDGKAVGMKRAGWGWHTDGEDKAIPNAGSMLYALELPPEGGDTLFADLYAAYEALGPDIKKQIAGRRARFSRIRLHHVHYPHLPALTDEDKAKRPDVWHPLVRRHPKSGRAALYIGRWACGIEGMPDEEGAELVRSLQEFAVQPEFVYRHRWRLHDAVLWDNRCAQHCATPFDDSKYRRHMLRTTIEGEIPMANHHPMEVRHRDDIDWETIRWPGETGKMLFHPRKDRPTEPNAGILRLEPGAHHPLHYHDFAQIWYVLEGTFQIGGRECGPGTMIFHPDPHYEDEFHTNTGGEILIVQYPGPTTGGRPVYDDRFNLQERRPIAAERIDR